MLEQIIIRYISNGVTLQELDDLVRYFKSLGVDKESMISALESSRASAPDDETEDTILEVMDFVVGCCSPKYQIYG